MPLPHLPLVSAHEAALETCAYCPKLCRAACPVSAVEPKETLIPWGKMSTAFFMARGDVPLDAGHAEPAWACTGCLGCRELCDHKNPVAATLMDARADLFAEGLSPEGARRAVARFAEHADTVCAQTKTIAAELQANDPSAKVAVLVGSSYVRHAPDVVRDALLVVRALVDEPVRLVTRCCGLPLLHAGDRKAFIAAARMFAEELGGAERVIGVDPGCTRAVAVDYASVGVKVPAVEPLVAVAASAMERLSPTPGAVAKGPARYHDPCQLGRGLGLYQEPRDLLERVLGRAPDELPRSRERAVCSGGGGLLPVTRPENSRAIADGVLAEHREAGGGTLITACGSSLRRFRSRGENAVDLVSILARALRPAPRSRP